MTTRIFIENATQFNWRVTDRDGHFFGIVKSNNYYGMKLNYSPTFDKTYILRSGQISFTITLDTGGEIKQITTNTNISIEIKNAEHHTLRMINPPYCHLFGNEPDYLIITPLQCHLAGHYRNKILITPANNKLARVDPPVSKSILDFQNDDIS